MSEPTPMMKQYWSVKEKHRDAILFFRLGDFYEMFFDDAKTASKILDLTLTSRNKNQEDAVPLCGVPVEAASYYINRLLSCGHKVAICEQTEDPKKAVGIVKREVVSVLTPGLVLDPDCLESKSANYLAAVIRIKESWGLAYADISTGVFKATDFFDEKQLGDELMRIDPREVILPDEVRNESWAKNIAGRCSFSRISFLPGWHFDADYGWETAARYYKLSPEGLGFREQTSALNAAGALLSYLHESKILTEGLLDRPVYTFFYEAMVLDENCKKNLELLKTQTNDSSKGSLFWLLDSACTSMGSRKIREWLLYPLLGCETLNLRHDAVEEFFRSMEFSGQIRDCLAKVSDLERIQNRILAQKVNPRELAALGQSAKNIPALRDFLHACRSKLLSEIKNNLDSLEDVLSEIERVLVDDPPLAVKEGGLIRAGVDSELDSLKDIEKNGKGFIARLEVEEREKTGISSLKVRYNRVFGYYIEITHTHKDKVPDRYIRKQTLTSAERYITPELKEYEDKVLGAGERIKELEYEIFVGLREKVSAQSDRIKKTARALAELDALCALARVARDNNYVRPEMTDETLIEIEKGRHPLVEKLNSEEPFVPNDVRLDSNDCRLMLITGPNMAGKSTVMRQTALICLMAQMGSFVPASKARLGIVDRIFTRVGASDHLQKGLSTFMVEMLETAQILSQATEKSLIILDEIGRGTSTFDGLSIAWAVCETLHDKIKARTLFATHYHELTDLSEEKSGIRNFQMAIKEWKGEIRFLRELKEGGSNRSYGVHVAAMAGLPTQTIERARQILKLLEEKDLDFRSRAISDSVQPSLFEIKEHPILDELKNLDINSLTPLEALNVLAKVQKEI